MCTEVRHTLVDPGESAPQDTRPEPERSTLADVQSDTMDNLPVELEVRFGTIVLPMGDLLQMQRGSILTTDGAAVELLAGGKPVARGEIVTVDERLAVRVLEIVDSESSEEG